MSKRCIWIFHILCVVCFSLFSTYQEKDVLLYVSYCTFLFTPMLPACQVKDVFLYFVFLGGYCIFSLSVPKLSIKGCIFIFYVLYSCIFHIAFLTLTLILPLVKKYIGVPCLSFIWVLRQDDHHRSPNVNNRDYLVGQLTTW